MINPDSIQAVNAALFSDVFRRPLYDSYCFSNLPQTLVSMLTGKKVQALPETVFGELPTRYEKVVFLFIDAFGWNTFEKFHSQYPILNEMTQNGVVSKLTSQFPSTTAAHITTVSSGKPVGEHGVYEWFYYEPKFDGIFAPLLYSIAGEEPNSLLEKNGLQPEEVFPGHNLYEQVKQLGIPSYTFIDTVYLHTPYSQVMLKDSHQQGFENQEQGFRQLSEAVLSEPGRGYYFYYYVMLDVLSHRFGTGSDQYQQGLADVFSFVQKTVDELQSKGIKDTLFVISADHGQIDVDPDRTWYLDREIPDVLSWLETNTKGEALVPAGSARDFFLHIKPDKLKEAKRKLEKALETKAQVLETSELITKGFFGPKLSETFLSRVGNLVILPYEGEMVWWYGDGRFKQRQLGHHGGLTPEEMEIPLILFPL